MSSTEQQNLDQQNPMIGKKEAVDLRDQTAQIVAAYVAHNAVPAAGLPEIIANVHAALSRLDGAATQEAAKTVARPATPAVPVKQSIANDYIVCLEDGKKFKSLKRHLRAHYGLTPEQYRERWSLPRDYPMTAPAYSERRSALAKDSGLGRNAGAGKRSSGGKQAA